MLLGNREQFDGRFDLKILEFHFPHARYPMGVDGQVTKFVENAAAGVVESNTSRRASSTFGLLPPEPGMANLEAQLDVTLFDRESARNQSWPHRPVGGAHRYQWDQQPR
jgi:hypothetical protein